MSAITRIDLTSARHGAAMARHGRRPSPAPAARPVGFSPATNHATCFPPVLRRLQREQPQARPTGFSRITNHETRITAFMLLSLLSCAPWRGIGRLWRGMGGRRPPRRQHGRLGFHQPRITQHVFPLPSGDSNESNPKPGQRVFHESRITKHESRPLCFCRCFPARRGAASGGYGAAWAAAVPRAGNTAGWVFTSHESRNMFFLLPSGDSNESNPKPGQRVFHESRITKHESRPLCFCRCFPARRGAASGGYGAAWAAAVPRAGNTAGWVFTSHESRNMFFPCPPATPRRATPSPANGFFTNHESRNTNHGLYAFVAAFLRAVARHRAAMARHGRPPSPAPATRPVGFSPATNHATCFSPALRRLQGEQPQPRPTGFSRITKHETRITAFMPFFPQFPTISRHFPAPPPTPEPVSARHPPFSLSFPARVVSRRGRSAGRRNAQGGLHVRPTAHPHL